MDYLQERISLPMSQIGCRRDLLSWSFQFWCSEIGWSTWDDGWSDAWTDTSWSVAQPPAVETVEKATSSAAPAALEPKATSGAPVSAVSSEPVPTSKAKAKAISKAAPKASGFPSQRLSLKLGSMFACASACVIAPHCPDVSLEGMLDGCVVFNDISVAGT